jgi:methionine-rich copper-binding protein CopC
MRTSAYWALVLLLSVVFLSATQRTSWGHACPDHSDPRVGSTVSGSPSVVRIWFDGDIEPVFSKIAVMAADGKTVDKGDSHVNPKDSTLLEVSVPPLSPGQYTVMWSVIARDGHHTEGRYTFTVK